MVINSTVRSWTARHATRGCIMAALLWFPHLCGAASLALPAQAAPSRSDIGQNVARAVSATPNALPAVVPATASASIGGAKVAKSPYPPQATKQEIEMGEKAVAALEKDPSLKLVDGKKDAVAQALLDKLNGMAREIGRVSTRPLINYNVKIIEGDDLNAFTLPNGHIYISRGLLDFAASDDEIAAVIGHEIGHTARMHVTRGQAKTKPLQWVSLAALLAMLKGGRNGANIAQITPYLLTGIVNSYSIEFEKEADQAAIDELKQTNYNPSALVTFMQRLGEEEKRHPKVELGIFQTHPPSPERATAALKAIADAGLTYAPRAVVGSRQAIVVEARDRASVRFGTLTLIELALRPDEIAANMKIAATQKAPLQAVSTPSTSSAAPTTKTASAPTAKTTVTSPAFTTPNGKPSSAGVRAGEIATRINQMLRDNLKWHEISVRGDGQEARLYARETEIARATLADARLQNTTPLALAQKWKANFGRLFWSETLTGAL